jgi:hypothetical protein
VQLCPHFGHFITCTIDAGPFIVNVCPRASPCPTKSSMPQLGEFSSAVPRTISLLQIRQFMDHLARLLLLYAVRLQIIAA